MRSVLILLAGLCASVATSLVLHVTLEWGDEPFVEVLDGGQLRTNVEEGALDGAVAQVLEANCASVVEAEERFGMVGRYKPGVPKYSPPDLFGNSTKWVSRLSRRQLDQFGRPLQIEVLEGDGAESLVIVHHDDREAANRIAHHLALKLAERGATSVN